MKNSFLLFGNWFIVTIWFYWSLSLLGQHSNDFFFLHSIQSKIVALCEIVSWISRWTFSTVVSFFVFCWNVSVTLQWWPVGWKFSQFCADLATGWPSHLTTTVFDRILRVSVLIERLDCFKCNTASYTYDCFLTCVSRLRVRVSTYNVLKDFSTRLTLEHLIK